MIKKLAILILSGLLIACSSQKQEEERSTTTGNSLNSDNYIPSGFHAILNHGTSNRPVSLLKEDTSYHLFYTTGSDELGHLRSSNLFDWQYQDPIEISSSYAGLLYDQFNTSGLSEAWVKYWLEDGELILATSSTGTSNWNERSVFKPTGTNPSITWERNQELWILTMINESSLRIYTSQDLLEWNDDTEISFENEIKSASISQVDDKWIVMVNDGEIKYITGTFDGTSFNSLGNSKSILDGSDFLSAHLHTVNDQTYLIAQGPSNSESEYPTFSIPLEVTLRDQDIFLFPSSEIKTKFSGKRRGKLSNLKAGGPSWYSFEVEKEFDDLKIELIDAASSFTISINTTQNTISFDRTNSSIGNPDIIESVMSFSSEKLKVDLLIDHNTIDIFFNDGEAYYSILNNPFSFFRKIEVTVDEENYDTRGILYNIGT